MPNVKSIKGSNTFTSLFETGLFQTRDIDLADGTLNSVGFKKWLEKKSKVLFYPLAEIIANRDNFKKILLKVNI